MALALSIFGHLCAYNSSSYTITLPILFFKHCKLIIILKGSNRANKKNTQEKKRIQKEERVTKTEQNKNIKRKKSKIKKE